MKAWGNGGLAPPFMTLALDGGEWSAACLCCFMPRERCPSTHRIGNWVDPRAILDTKEEKYLESAGNQTLAIEPVAHHYIG
jgi:hypothetical protein